MAELVAILSVAAGLVVLFFFVRRRAHQDHHETPISDQILPEEPTSRTVHSIANWQDATDTHARDWAMAGEVLLANRLHVSILIRYRASNGALTERTVTVHTIGGRRTRGRGTYLTSLQGFCHLRLGVRSFYAARIDGAFDPRTGEQIKNLGEFLLNRPDLIMGDPPPPPSKMGRKKADGTPRDATK